MLWRDRLVQSIFACHWASTYHIYARIIFERQKLKYLTELEIYIFVSIFIYFHTLCLREGWTLVCLGLCADSSKCSLLAHAVSTVCRPNMSSKPKPFSAVIAYPGYQALRYAWVRARFYRFLVFTMGVSIGRDKGQDKQLDPPPGNNWNPPPEKCWIPSGTSENDSFYESNRWSFVK